MNRAEPPTVTGGIVWTDVGPRDGLQNLPEDVAASTATKVRMVLGLLAAGIPRVEATSFVSPRWVPRMADAAEVLAGAGAASLPRLRVLVPNLRGLELALDHGVANVVVTVGATDAFNRRNVNRPVEASLEEVARILELAAGRVAVDVAVSVAFGCPFEGRVDPERVRVLCARLLDAGCAEVCVADTIGVAAPAQVEALCADLVAAHGDRVALHVHDTRGLGVANVLAAAGAGVTRFEGSVGGLGGCPFAPRSTGNVCSEDAIGALLGAGFDVGDVDLDALCEVATGLGEELGRELPGRLHRAGVWHPERTASPRASPPQEAVIPHG